MRNIPKCVNSLSVRILPLVLLALRVTNEWAQIRNACSLKHIFKNCHSHNMFATFPKYKQVMHITLVQYTLVQYTLVQYTLVQYTLVQYFLLSLFVSTHKNVSNCHYGNDFLCIVHLALFPVCVHVLMLLLHSIFM